MIPNIDPCPPFRGMENRESTVGMCRHDGGVEYSVKIPSDLENVANIRPIHMMSGMVMEQYKIERVPYHPLGRQRDLRRTILLNELAWNHSQQPSMPLHHRLYE